MKTYLKQIVFIILLPLFIFAQAFAWHDETHLSVAKAAGYTKWYNAAGADIAKIKSDRIERNNHYFNNNANIEVTQKMIFEQSGRYNDPADSEGHLYGAILAALREYGKTVQQGKYPEYHIAFCAHYTADLSQPLHNTFYDEFNQKRHSVNDGIVENEALNNISKIEKNMYPVILRPEFFEEDLALEIARIANIARKLGQKMREEKRDMTKDEVYIQLGHSASLFKAILKHLGKIE